LSVSSRAPATCNHNEERDEHIWIDCSRCGRDAWRLAPLGHLDTAQPPFPSLPLGTLTANLLGGYLIGIAVALFPQHASWPPEARLLVVTGFLGALTTFSTFSAEIVDLFLRGQTLWSIATAGAHLLGALAMTVFGIYSVTLLAKT